MVSRQWTYLAETAQGGVEKGSISAGDLDAAIATLKSKGLYPLKLDEKSRSGQQLLSLDRKGQTLSPSELIQFTSRMSEFLNAGISATKSLKLIERQASSTKLEDFASRLQGRLREGKALSTSLAEDDLTLPSHMIALVKSGEVLGDLGGQFARLAASFEKQDLLRKELTSQLIYPFALFVMIILTMIFLSFVVLPQFETVFANASALPPIETRIVLSAGAFVREYWLIGAFSTLLSFASLKAFIQYRKATWEKALLKVPFIGPTLREKETAQYCRSLGELLLGGMPLARAMPIARATLSIDTLRRDVEKIEHAVKNGASLSQATKATPCLDREANPFFEMGEETGDLGAMVEKAADFLEQKYSTTLKRFATLSGPIMTAIMGIVTAGVIAAVMTGVLSLNETVY